jgi:hypothetical protein
MVQASLSKNVRHYSKNNESAWHMWLTPVILATQEAEIRIAV